MAVWVFLAVPIAYAICAKNQKKRKVPHLKIKFGNLFHIKRQIRASCNLRNLEARKILFAQLFTK